MYAQKHRVDIALPADCDQKDVDKIKKAYQKHLGVDLKALNFVISPFGAANIKWQLLLWTMRYDVVYFVTDGSAFYSLARRNIMHIQVPLLLGRKSGWERVKFKRFKVINANSNFTKKTVEKYWDIKVNMVCQPGVEVGEFQLPPAATKEKIILNVGRFFDSLHTKNQDSLVEFWRELCQKHPEETKDWKLVLVGKVES